MYHFLAMASGDKCKYDINILCSGYGEPPQIRALSKYLKEKHNLSTYSRSDYELGMSIFDAVSEGIQSSR